MDDTSGHRGHKLTSLRYHGLLSAVIVVVALAINMFGQGKSIDKLHRLCSLCGERGE